MFRTKTKTEILRDLDPTSPASIQALIDFHRENFGDLRMEADDDKGGEGDDKGKGQQDDKSGKGETGKPGDDKAGGKPGDQSLGAAGIKALQAERDARQKLETELRDFKAGQADQAKKLAAALGIETENGSKPEDVVAELQKQIQEMQRETLVFRVAADPAHPITDADDLELLKGQPDESAMRKLAARLAKPKDSGNDDGKGGDGNGRRFPRQDPNQGRGTSGDSRPSSVAAVREERAQARAARQQRHA